MARTTATAGQRSHVVTFDEPRRRGDLYQSLLLAQLVDELTGEPVFRPVRVSSDLSGSRARVAGGGVCGIAGVPSRLLPSLAIQAYPVTIGFEVDGYVPLRQEAEIPQQPGFPELFDDVELATVDLRRLPVVLVVRTVELDALNRPVALPAADVEVSGVWRMVGDLGGAPVATDLVGASPAIYAPRPVPGTTLEPVILAPVVEPDRRLLVAVEPGTRRLEVSRRGGLVPGSVVGIDAGEPDRVEHITVASVEGPSDLESPATVVLAHAGRRGHREGATVQVVTLAPAAPAVALTDTAQPGDATVFVTSTTPFAGGSAVRVSGGAAPDEYVVATPYARVTDGEGYCRLPPLARVAAVQVTAAAGALTAAAAPFTLRYDAVENHLGLTLE